MTEIYQTANGVCVCVCVFLCGPVWNESSKEAAVHHFYHLWILFSFALIENV